MHKTRFGALSVFIYPYFTFHSIYCVCLHANNTDNSSGVISPLSPKVSALLELCAFPLRLQSGVNLQVCFVNDSSSDKDSDAEDTRTETSLDTPLSPVVCTLPHTLFNIYLNRSRNDIINIPCTTSSPEQAELIVIGPRHGGGGLGPAR